MNRGEAERLLREAGFVEHVGKRHVQWRKGDIWIGLSHRRARLTVDEESAIERKLRKAKRPPVAGAPVYSTACPVCGGKPEMRKQKLVCSTCKTIIETCCGQLRKPGRVA